MLMCKRVLKVYTDIDVSFNVLLVFIISD